MLLLKLFYLLLDIKIILIFTLSKINVLFSTKINKITTIFREIVT